MRRYGDTDGNCSVRAFELSVDSITVEFSDGTVYLYNHSSAGIANIQQMKQLALNGKGLDNYIIHYARKAHAAQLQ
jgi:hypothetical protein